jgi:monoamine oxidase
MNRRTVVLLLGALLTRCRRPAPARPVIVIGAGIAGLAAAFALRRQGYPVVIVEALDRVGGRVYSSSDFSSQPIDLGAELVHGGSVVTWDAVRKQSLETRPVASVLQFQGRVAAALDPEPSLASTEALVALIASLPDWQDLSVTEALDQLRPTIAPGDFQALTKLASVDLDPEHSSARAALAVRSDPHRDGGDFMIRGGMSGILAAFESDADRRLGFVVEHVEVVPDGVRVTSRTGEVVLGSSAIVTLPLGVLRHRDVRFTPPLPVGKQRAIDGLGMTTAVKLFLRFPRRVLPAGVDAVLVPNGLPRAFWVTGFDGATDQVLTGWAVHRDAMTLLAMGETAALERALDTLRREVSASLPDPLAMRWSEWESHPQFRGAYSATPVGAGPLRAVLAAPSSAHAASAAVGGRGAGVRRRGLDRARGAAQRVASRQRGAAVRIRCSESRRIR